MRRINYRRARCPQCAPSGGTRRLRGSVARRVGGAMMVTGLAILVAALPVRFWFALVGMALLAAGFVIWTFF